MGYSFAFLYKPSSLRIRAQKQLPVKWNIPGWLQFPFWVILTAQRGNCRTEWQGCLISGPTMLLLVLLTRNQLSVFRGRCMPGRFLSLSLFFLRTPFYTSSSLPFICCSRVKPTPAFVPVSWAASALSISSSCHFYQQAHTHGPGAFTHHSRSPGATRGSRLTGGL